MECSGSSGRFNVYRKQFRLSRLFVVTMLAAVMACVVGREFATRQQERSVAQRLVKAGLQTRWENSRVISVSRPPSNDKFVLRKQDLASIAQLSALRSVRLWNSNLSDTSLERLCDSLGLNELNIGATEISSSGARHLAALRQLETLNLYGTAVDDGSVTFIPSDRLRSLSIGETNVTAVGLRHLASFPTLEKLWLMGLNLSDDDLRPIAGMKRLKELWINSSSITDQGVLHVVQLTDIRILRMPDTSITDQCVDCLKRLESLTLLSVSNTLITELGVLELSEIKTLKELNALEIDVSPNIERTIRENRPSLKLHLRQTRKTKVSNE